MKNSVSNRVFDEMNFLIVSELERSVNKSPTGSRGSHGTSRQGSHRAVSTTAEAVAKKKREMRESIEEAAMELLAHFNHRNIDALLKVVRNTLESMRKRITSSSMVHYLGGKHISGDYRKLQNIKISFEKGLLFSNEITDSHQMD